MRLCEAMLGRPRRRVGVAARRRRGGEVAWRRRVGVAAWWRRGGAAATEIPDIRHNRHAAGRLLPKYPKYLHSWSVPETHYDDPMRPTDTLRRPNVQSDRVTLLKNSDCRVEKRAPVRLLWRAE